MHEREDLQALAAWHSPPDQIEVEGEAVDTWTWDLEGHSEDLRDMECILSADERLRMSRFHFQSDQERFLVARSGLRRVLARYLYISPAALKFEHSRHGKPHLNRRFGTLNFNLSHTKRAAVAAVTMAGPVGIDIEDIRPIDLAVADAVFSQQEKMMLEALSPLQRREGFYRCWTRKEAICKGEGLGFHLETVRFSVSLRAGEPLRVDDTGGILSHRWHLVDLPLGEETAGALAVTAPPSRLRYFQFR